MSWAEALYHLTAITTFLTAVLHVAGTVTNSDTLSNHLATASRITLVTSIMCAASLVIYP